MKKIVIVLSLCLSWLIIKSQKTMYVENNKILTACDEEVVMRGVNEMFIWSQDKMGVSTLPEIAKTGSNTVRLVWTSDGDPAELDSLIKNCLANNMIPVPELHDATGDFNELQKLLDYWKTPEVLAIVQKYKQWIIVNIGNEVGDGAETNEQWEAYYLDAITQLRDAGIDVPLMIDCGSYGSNEEYFLSKGNNLMNHDPLHNLIFSVHTYWISPNTDQGRKDRLDDLIEEAKTKNLPFIIGEGPQKAASPWSTYCGVDFPYKYLMKRCEEEGIGWLSWSWGLVDNNDCGAPNSVFDITTDGLYGNWSTTFAEEIMVTDSNSIINTSVVPNSLITGNCGTFCTPVILSSSDLNLCSSGTSTLSIENTDHLTAQHSISWYLNKVRLENETSTSILVSEQGDYVVEIDSASACVVFDEVKLSKEIEVDLGDDLQICSEPSVLLNVNLNDLAYSVNWFKDDVLDASATDLVNYEVSQPGDYVVSVVSDYCQGKDTVSISSKLPMINDTVICGGVDRILSVEGNGNYAWYSDVLLHDLVFTGSEYEVNLTEKTTYYVRDESGFQGTVGKVALDNSFWDTWDAESMENKLGFEVFEDVMVETMDVYAVSSGEMNVVFYDESLVVLTTLTFDVVSGQNTLDIQQSFEKGVYYADVAGSDVNLRFNHNEGDYNTVFPYNLENGSNLLLSIDRTSPSWIAGKPWYLFFYNWNVSQSNGAECIAQEFNVDVVSDNECLVSNLDTEIVNPFTISPNPSKEVLRLSEAVSWQLFDTKGNLSLSGYGDSINISTLYNGVYYLKSNGMSHKIIKM